MDIVLNEDNFELICEILFSLLLASLRNIETIEYMIFTPFNASHRDEFNGTPFGYSLFDIKLDVFQMIKL